MEQIAYLEFESKVYWSRYSPQAKEPNSATLQLIQGIYENHSEHARSILRQRIFTNYAISDLDRAAVRVGAKRISECAGTFGSKSEADTIEIKFSAAAIAASDLPCRLAKRGEIEAALKRLETNCQRTEQKRLSDRPVACLLLDGNRNVLSSAWNANHRNRSLHAELRMLQDYWKKSQKPIPQGAVIFCSLQPCRMCAAAIWHLCEDPFSIRVVFQEVDRGSAARGTILQVGSSPEEKRRLEESPVEMHMDRAEALGIFD